jgi:uncharacterized glyoxalase superfamily protein PhnB
LIVSDAAAAIDLYKKAFGATEEYRMACPDTGKIMHACIYFGSSKIFLSDENPNMECSKATHSNFYVYLKDVNSAFSTAKQAGMEEVMPPEDMFWGDRTGSVKDKFGNYWTLATHVRDVSPQEMEEGKKKFAEKMAGKQ